VPNRHQPPFGAVNLGKWAIPLWWKIAQWMINGIFLKQINQLRLKHDQKPNHDVLTQAWSNDDLNLIAVSPAICPPNIPWPSTFRICGFLNPSDLNQDQALTQDVKDFLRLHPNPLYFTFGSMLVPDEASWYGVYEIWRKSVKELGCSAIFQLPVSEPSHLPVDPDILIIRRAPHHLIFPLCSAVIHHGGAGTTQSSLLAGCPSVVVAHIADQPFWGSELKRLGVSPGFMRKSEMNTPRLTKLLSLVFKDSKYRENANRISQAMKMENGIQCAIHELSDYVRNKI